MSMGKEGWVLRYSRNNHNIDDNLLDDNILKHNKKVKEGYERHLVKHDPHSPEAVHWRGKDKTWLRFKILTEIDDLNGKVLLDFGCGNALLLDYLKEKGIKVNYYGWDISEKMVNVARNRHPDANFRSLDIFEEDLDNYIGFFDYILISGVFYIKFDSDDAVHERWMQAILLRLWPLTRLGIGFNCLTEYVDWRDESLYYASINKLLDFIVGNLSRWFVIRHDYKLWEMTFYVYRYPRVEL